MARCEWCKGAVYTEKDFEVVTQMGRHVHVQFNFCPVCGSDLRVEEEENVTSEEETGNSQV
jgi:hypothetical protein